MRQKKYFLFSIIIPIALILMLYIFHITNNIIVIKSDKTPIMADSVIYYFQSTAMYKTLFEAKQGFKRIIYDKFYNQSKPPLYALSALPWYLIFGIGQDVMCYSNLFFMLILIVAVFFMGKHFHGTSCGLLASFIITTYPIVFGMSRWCMPYFMSLALVSLAVLFIIKSKGFFIWRFSIAAGISSGLAVITHQSSLFALILPYLFFFIDSLCMAENKATKIRRTANFLCSLLFMPLLTFLWITFGDADMFSYMQKNDNLPRIDSIIEGLKNFLFAQLFHIQLHKVYVFLLIFSGAVLFFKKRKIFLFLALWYFSHTAIVSMFVESRTARFNMASLPSLALITSLGVNAINLTRVRKSLITFIVLFGVFQYLVISYYPEALRYYPHMTPLNSHKRLITDDQVNHQGLLQANRIDWKEDEIVDLISKDDLLKNKKRVKVWIIYGKASICGALRSKIHKDKLPIYVFNAANDDKAQGLTPYTRKDIEKDFMDVDYILTYDERSYDTGEKWQGFLEMVSALFNENMDKFTEIESLKMPDQNTLRIYKSVK